jgi:DNA helicase-2/ATP-dependent DNA helicase PcrA
VPNNAQEPGAGNNQPNKSDSPPGVSGLSKLPAGRPVGNLLFSSTIDLMDFDTRYGKLNAAQKQAVDTIDGPVMVIAGPGTGKTELLSMRTANILGSTDTLPENILCLTFTESGADAMRERLTQIIGPSAYKVAIHTFHSFGSEIINQNATFFYHGANFRPADELSTYELIRGIFDELDYNNPLASKMNGEYTHLRDTLAAISELKKSGLTSDELLAILSANDAVMDSVESILSETFSARISKTTAGELTSIVSILQKSPGKSPLPTTPPLGRIIADSLEQAIEEAIDSNSTKPVTAWRNHWMKKDENGKHVFKSRERARKLQAVSNIYFQYLTRMQQAELYDFDDMILRVVHAMEVFDELRFNLQEKYQYVMVDEFQDTNMAQMRILFNLTNNEVSGGRPNIMVVGDDDQAIYSFQGADVGNISSFRDIYDQTELITLVDNYRSTDQILRSSRQVITQGYDRLENHIPELNKTLVAHTTAQDTAVTLVELPSKASEYEWLAREVASRIRSGIEPSSIAVLARRHYELIALPPYFAKEGVKINYERRDNVLELEVIQLIEHIAALLVALFEQRHDDANSLLPEMLAHPAFSLEPLTIWQLSVKAMTSQKSWMEIMAATPEFMPIHKWLVEHAQSLPYMPLERMIDEIVGVPPEQPFESQPAEPVESAFISPLYGYFFADEKLQKTPDAYLTYLEALRAIRTRLNEYQPNDPPTLQTFLEFMRLHRELGSTITSVRPHTDHIDNAIHLMTAHKSKGLEFDTVYITGSIDTNWGERVRSRSRLISYPENLPLAPSGDTFDERLRLFFVAMTRARHHLTISYGTNDQNGKETLPASFLVNDSWQAIHPEVPTTIENLVESAKLAWYQPLVQPLSAPLRDLLAPTLTRYKLSSTHLTSFLDVTRGGPQAFLVNNLLRFPRAVNPSAGYGLAVHSALQRAHAHVSATGNQRPLEDVLHDFEEQLKNYHLKPDDFRSFLQKGTDVLSDFLEAQYGTFTPTQKTELNFASQNVHVGNAHLTGTLDLVNLQENTIIVTDYKTGRPSRDWTGKADYEKIKLHRYKQQLMFYHLLIMQSRDYSRYNVEKGVLQFVEPTNNGELIALEARFSNDDLAQFSHLIQAVWHCITTLELPDTSGYDSSFKGILEFEHDLLSGS